MRIQGVLLAGLFCVAACGSDPALQVLDQSSDVERATRPGEYFVSDLGVRVGVRTRTFPVDIEVTDAVVVYGDSRNGYPWPLDYDPDLVLDPLPIHAGTAALVEGGAGPDCAEPESTIPHIEMTYTSATGGEQRMRIDLDNPADFVTAAREWCDTRELNLSLGGSGQWPDGRFYVELSLSNPTDGNVLLVSEAFEGPDGRYEYAEIDVPPRTRRSLRIEGNGEGCSHEGPWAHGLVTADGVPLEAPSEDEGEADVC